MASVTHSNCQTLFARGDKALELYKEVTNSPSENDKLSFNPHMSAKLEEHNILSREVDL
jgi:hypothetical protein